MSSDQHKAELRKKVEFQVACEEKAFRIVERLIENPITQDFLQDALNFITPSHYSDIVEERAVSKLCGYPLCPNTLDKVLKQKYMISTKTNKVYDIEERKNFCSGQCYKASVHLEKQVSTDPLWMRKSRPPTQFSFLALDMQIGKVGDEVFLNMAEDLKQEIKTIEKMDEYQQRLEERKAKVDKTSYTGKDKHVEYNDQSRKGESSSNSVDQSTKSAEKQRTGLDSGQGDQSLIDKLAADDDLRIVTSDVVKASINATNTKSSSEILQSDRKDNSVKTSKQSKSKSKGGNPQTEYLMKLLDKRKELLSKMADIQPTGVASPAVSHPSKSQDGGQAAYTLVSVVQTEALKGTKKSDVGSENNEHALSCGNPESVEKISFSCENSETNHSIQSKGVDDDRQPARTRKPKVISPVEVIIDCIKSWITKDSLAYLHFGDNSDVKENKTKFEKQYQELVAKVDAQEKDFDNMIGEEVMDGPEDTYKAPPPDYEQLKKETEENLQKVNTFLRGTYRVKEKNTTKDRSGPSSEIVLPTLDKFNQMVIRRKIVMDRISQVLPELLSPLQLLIQDVSTELRELVSTFDLTSENIIFKPAEWILVTLVLLKLLCRKVKLLERSFTSPATQTHLSLLLQAVHCDMDKMDTLVQSLLS